MQIVTPLVSLLLRERKGGLTCKCFEGTFTGHKRKLTKHIAGKNFLNDKEMGVLPRNPVVMIKQGNQLVPNTVQQAFFKRARLLLLKYFQQQDERTVQKQGQ